MNGIYWFKDITEEHPVGGKGLNLAKMFQNGFPVPNGFVIIPQLIAKLIDVPPFSLNLDESKEELKRLSSLFREKIRTASICEDTFAGIIKQFRSLKTPMVAVRSSGIAEDSNEKSFAGQFSSYLNVGEYNLAHAIKEVYASKFSSNSIDYQKTNSSNELPTEMAIVVMEMVPASFAGTLFTSNENSHSEEEIIIEVVSGLGDKLLSGSTTAHQFIVDKKSKMILERKIESDKGYKKIRTQFENVIGELVEHGLTLETLFKVPQDIEWTFTKEKGIQIVQSRPITSKSEEKGPFWAKQISRGYGVHYTEISIRSLHKETQKLTGLELNSQTYVPNGKNQLCFFKQREWDEFKRQTLEKWGEDMPGLENKFMEIGQKYLDFSQKMGRSSLVNPDDLNGLSKEELIKLFQEYVKRAVDYTAFIWIIYFLNDYYGNEALVALKSYDWSDVRWKSRFRDWDSIYHSLEGFFLSPQEKAPIVRMNEQLNALPIAKFDEKRKAISSLNEVYLKYYWILCLDIHNPPFDYVDFVVKYHDSIKMDPKVGRLMEEADWTAEANQLFKKKKVEKPDQAVILKAQKLVYLKDYRDYFRRKSVYHARATLFSQIANRLHLKVEDLSYMTTEEVVKALEKGKVDSANLRERKEGFGIFIDGETNDIEVRSGKEIDVLLSQLKIDLSLKYDLENSHIIKGRKANQGVAKGPAKIVRSVEDLDKVEKGDILISITTNAAYLSAMQKVAAIVTDEGSVNCHAAIISREYGIPCIVGTGIATEMIEDGMTVMVDANHGEVIVSKEYMEKIS